MKLDASQQAAVPGSPTEGMSRGSVQGADKFRSDAAPLGSGQAHRPSDSCAVPLIPDPPSRFREGS